MAKLVIVDPETGERVCALVIPPGATQEQIVAAGAAMLKKYRAQRAATNGSGSMEASAVGTAKPIPSRDVLCQLCRQPIPESQLAAHVEQEQQRLVLLEMQAEAQRGRR